MRYLRLFSATLAVAVCVLGAMMAASASALPTLLPETAQEWTGESRGQLEFAKANGRRTACSNHTMEGTVEAGKPLGLFHIHFKECSAEGGLGKCTGTGEETGVILALGSWHFVYDTLKAALNEAGVAILFLLGKVVFKCSIVTIEVLLGGMLLCLILNPLALTKHFEYHCNKRATGPFGPEETKYDNETGTWIPIHPLEANENGGRFEELVLAALLLVLFTADQLIMV